MDNHISSRALLHRRDVIKSNPRFGEAILEHYTINDTIYKKQPLFYKTMLQESRFNIILSMCCFIFGNQAESVSEIKELCSRYKIASPGNDSNLLIVFYVQIMPDDFVMQLHR
ncbi:hypothetical protein M8O30_16340, partial [Enterobacter roggenkampii]|nr:hypothetical protein [Enterobacter roggenkampii]